MKKQTVFKFAFPWLLVLFFCASGPLPDLSAQASKSGISRSMEQAIRLYHEGEDTEAMDRFMQILVKGTPSEKALANEYITKITLRMNTGVNSVKDRGAEPTTLTEVSQPRSGVSPRAVPLGIKAGRQEEMEEERGQQDDAESQKARVSEKIAAKIDQTRRNLLLEMGSSDAVKIYMGDGVPKALTLDPNFFFANEATFRPGTDKMLSNISGLVFTLGKANCLILPEGSAEGDVKIKSIRRALALNSYLESRGVSKSRLEVNLTGTDVRFPKELTNISGLIILFDYDKQPRLKDIEDLQTKGPKVSLGIYPTAISVQNNEGSIVEFSAFESPIGIPSWKFQVFEIQKDGSRLMLQEISGSGPQYNQSFWNGRKKFFGEPYPSGRYMFTVTATDVEGRETSLSRLLLVRPTKEEELAQQSRTASQRAAEKETVTKSGLKARSLGAKGTGLAAGKKLKGAAGKKGRLSKKGSSKKARALPKNKVVAEAPDAEAPAAGEGAAPSGEAAPPGEPSGQVSYKVYFTEANTLTLTSGSEKRLAQVAETMGYYPMANIKLIGYAYSGEPNAEAVAESRVNLVAARLSEKYKIDRSRMDLQSKVTEATKRAVEIKMTGKE